MRKRGNELDQICLPARASFGEQVADMCPDGRVRDAQGYGNFRNTAELDDCEQHA